MAETAWALIVVSSEAQSETLADQRRWCEATALEHSWPITRFFEGVSSGNHGARKLLSDLITELRATPKAQRPTRILTIRIDRLGRGDGLEVIAAIADLRKLGVTVHTREGGDVAIRRATDAILPAIRAITAGIENEARSDKWKAVHARRRALGLHVGQVPFGVVLVDGKANPYEPEAGLVREIFERAALGWGYTRLALYARERAPDKRQVNGSERRYHWAPSTIKSLLQSTTIRGLVVDEGLWQRAQTRKAEDFRTRYAPRYPWPLVGAVKCECGHMLRGHASGNEPHRIRYMICFNVEHGRPYPSHRADALEEQFVKLLRSIEGNPAQFATVKDDSAGLRSRERKAKKRLADLDARKRRAWVLGEEGGIAPRVVAERLAELESDRHRAEVDLEAVARELSDSSRARAATESLKEVLAGIADRWLDADVATQRAIAEAVAAFPEVGGFWVSPNRKHALYPGAARRARKLDATRALEAYERLMIG